MKFKFPYRNYGTFDSWDFAATVGDNIWRQMEITNIPWSIFITESGDATIHAPLFDFRRFPQCLRRTCEMEEVNDNVVTAFLLFTNNGYLHCRRNMAEFFNEI